MAYYSAAQRTDGRWDYTCSNGAGTFPIGYCCTPGLLDSLKQSWETATETSRLIYHTKEHYESERQKWLPFLYKYHIDGHATAEEATACHKEYELDRDLRFYTDEGTQKKCQVCNEWTTGRATCGTFGHYDICPTHQTREDLSKLHV